MSSILTNNSAMVALQTLKSINKNLAMTQNEISTGKSVSSAKDNSAVWAISKVMESDVAGFKAVSESLALGESTVAVARNASETITDLLTEMKGRITAAQEDNVDRDAIQQDIVALRDQVTSVVSAAQFNGLNLIDGSSTDALQIVSSLDRSSAGAVTAANISVARQSLSVNGTTTTQVVGTTAANGDFLDTDRSGGAAIAQGGGTLTFSVDNIATNASFEITLENVQLDTGGNGTAVGSRTFEYVADETDSVQSAARAIFNQIEEYFNTETSDLDTAGTPDYTVTFDEATAAITITNNRLLAADALTFTSDETNDGTPGSAAGSTGLGALNDIDVSSTTGANQALDQIDGLIQVSIDAAAAFGSAQTRIETQSSFVSQLSDNFKSGIGALVDADMEEVSARLQALQTQQQLGVQSLSIANQAPQTILSLFR
ncbi:MAG: flagellin [Pseudomonadota bacterium]